MPTTDLLCRSVRDLAELVRAGEISALELATESLARIEAHDHALGAFLSVQAEAALESARAVDAKRARGETLGALAGVPIGLKDALCTHDAPTTAASKVLTRAAEQPTAARDGYRPPYDATVVARLRNADAVLIGKCNMDEFAMGSSNENSAFGPARNPWDRTRTPGGSSGGSAVAVAASMCVASLGSDTGGSVRQPAAMTGCVGIKPTYGRVSRYGLIAFASSLDQVGPFARDVRSAARILEVIAGPDPQDATSLPDSVGELEAACEGDVRGLRVGLPAEYFAAGIEPEVERLVRAAITKLEELGAEIVPIELPHTESAVATYYVIATAEASSNLARYDGVRYGLRAATNEPGLTGMYRATRGAGLGAEVKRRIMLGTYVLSAGYYDAYYLRAQRVRTLIRRDFMRAFDEVDLIAAPVSPTAAFRLGERSRDPMSMYLADIYTLPASLAGLPAISVPCGLTSTTSSAPSLPVGLQLMAPPLAEDTMLRAAAAYEAVAPALPAAPQGAASKGGAK